MIAICQKCGNHNWDKVVSGNRIMCHTYHRQFFDKVYVLALVAPEEDVRERMEKGRGIKDQNWIQSSVDYNHYFMTHKEIGDMPFDILNTANKGVQQVADQVKVWIQSCLNKGESRLQNP